MQIEILLNQLLNLGQLQNEALQLDNIDEVIKLMDERNIIFKELKKIAVNLAELSEEEKQLLIQVNMLDKKNELLLGEKLEDTKKQIKSLRISQKRDQHYINPYSNLSTGRNFSL